MNDRITTFAESLFMFWQYPFLLCVMVMSGHKIWFCFQTYTDWLDQKLQRTDYTIQSNMCIYFHYWKQLAFHRKMSYEDYIVLSLSIFANPSTFCNTTHCAMCTKLCLCGGGYGCTNSVWSGKKLRLLFSRALWFPSFQTWKNLLIY